MTNLVVDYKIPAELQLFIDSGFLELSSERESEKTAFFVIPSMGWTEENGNEVIFTLTWIHPDFNAQFCHYYETVPGDLPNFYLYKQTSDYGDEQIDIEDLDDLTCWLGDKQK